MLIKYIGFLFTLLWSYSFIRTQSLFKKRTGVTYQNWLQAWSVTLQQEKEVFEVVVPYATETSTQSYKHIKWSK